MIAFDAQTTPGAGVFSFTHTPVGTPKGVLVMLVQNDLTGVSADEVSGVTYGGVPMAEVTDSPLILNLGSEHGAVYGYFLGSGIPTGPQTVAITTSGGGKRAISLTVTAAGDTTVEDTATFQSALTSAPSATLVTGVGVETFAIAGFFTGANNLTDITPGADYTQIVEHDYGSELAAWMYRTINASGGNYAANWIITGGDEESSILAIAIKEAATVVATKLAMVV